MKKLLLFVVIATMLFGTAGCTSPTDTTTTSVGVPTLTLYIPGDKQPDMALILEKANAIIEPKIGAKLNLQMIDFAAFQEKMTMMMAGGEVFDMTFTGYGNNYDGCVNKGGLLDITDLIDKHAPKLRDVVRPYAFEDITRKGRIYGIPNTQIMAGIRSLFIRKDIADEYGLDVNTIKKVDDIEPFLEWSHKKYPDLFPYQPGQGVGAWDCQQYVEIENTMGVKHSDLLDNNDTAKVEWLRETEIDQYAMDRLRTWYKKGYIRPDVLSVIDDSLDKKAGKYIVTTGSWKPGGESESFNATGKEVVVAKFPETSFVSGASNALLSISRTSENPEKSMEFIELINTDKDLFNLLSYGIEGKHYTVNAEGKSKLLPQSGYFQNASWKFGNVFNSIVLEGQDSDVWEQTQKLNDTAQVSPLLGFVLDTSTIKSQISSVQSINDQYKVLQSGAEDKSVFWNDYKSKLETAGLRKIQEETQRQVDAFLKNKKDKQ